jgi:hypothetical protein
MPPFATGSLALDFNQLSGEIPSSLGGLSFLEILRVKNNNLVGTMPSEICSLQEMGGVGELKVDCDEVSCSCCDGCR